MIETKKKEK